MVNAHSIGSAKRLDNHESENDLDLLVTLI